MFAMYPIFPTEFLSVATATPAELAIAQVSVRVNCDLSTKNGGRAVEVFSATVLSGSGASELAWSAEDVIAGLKEQMANTFGPNLLCDTRGGGIENVGISRAVAEMLLSAPSRQVRTHHPPVLHCPPIDPDHHRELDIEHHEDLVVDILFSCVQWIELFPLWPKKEHASFGGLMAKGGFRLWANYTPSGGVSSPVRLKSVAGASAVLLNPSLAWPQRQCGSSGS
jgi:hypothetical protein